MTVHFQIVFATPPTTARLGTSQGELKYAMPAPDRLTATVRDARLEPGPPATVISLEGGAKGSFYLRDVRAGRPMVAPALGFAVTTPDDDRDYVTLVAKYVTQAAPMKEPDRDRIMAEIPHMPAPVWLGLGGDARIFRVAPSLENGCWGVITPWFFHHPVGMEDNYTVEWDFTVGRGSPCAGSDISTRLEQDALPIVRSRQVEGQITYEITLFATSDTGDMRTRPPRGTAWEAAYLSTMGCMFDEAHRANLQQLYRAEVTDRPDKPVCCLRVTARNHGNGPAYAWYRAPSYKNNTLPPHYPNYAGQNKRLRLDTATGWRQQGDRIFSLNRLNGRPLPHEEMAVLVEAGASIVFECLLPFQPLPQADAARLDAFTFDHLLDDCRDHWLARMGDFPRWQLPEKHWDRRLQAGRQHLMMNLLGELQARETPLLATVGVYAPIGTESTPILWHLDASGRHDWVRRCLDYFFRIQRDDGYIQSFNHYDAETGPVLALAYRHYLITGDHTWIKTRLPALKRAGRYLIDRRQRTMEKDGPDHPGYGMLSGKIADPDEYYHQFVLNIQAADGLTGLARLLDAFKDPDAEATACAAEALCDATRRGFQHVWASAPLVPATRGDWCPFPGTWPGLVGESSLYTAPGNWFTHGCFHTRAAQLLHFVCFGLIAAEDPRFRALMQTLESVVLTQFANPYQPYGRRTDFYYAATNQREKYLETLYRQNALIQDRETLTFWEHTYKLSSQKTHEEAWFLQQLTWLFCFEEAGCLSLLKVAPAAWFALGARLDIPAMATTCGRLQLRVEALPHGLSVELSLGPGAVRDAHSVRIRLPAGCFEPPNLGQYDSITGMLDLGPGPLEVSFLAERIPDPS